MKKLLLSVLLYGAAAAGPVHAQGEFTRYVDPMIGTGGHGHVFAGANVPFGMVQAGPTNTTQGWDWTSGYHFKDETLAGFTLLHLSGTGIGDLGDIAFLPQVRKGEEPKLITLSQVVRPGYYKVQLTNGVKAELAAANRGAVESYHYPTGRRYMQINLHKGTGWDAVTGSGLKQTDPYTIEGYRYSTGWATNQKVFFYARFDAPIIAIELRDTTSVKAGKEIKGKAVYATLEFGAKNAQVTARIGVSAVSAANARQNYGEVAGLSLNTVAANADRLWNEELGKVDARFMADSTRKIFYTALYHTMIAPSNFTDRNGEYFGADGKVHVAKGFTNYSTFSLWDTYRAAHPLFTILQPGKSVDFVNTMLNIYAQQGKLPVWHFMGNETNTMVGNPAIPVVADAVLKGLPGINKQLAYRAMTASANLDERGLKYMRTLNYLPFDRVNESVATGLEYALADYQISKLAKTMAPGDFAYWRKRGESYRNYFDTSTGFMRGKDSNGRWRTPFNPFESVHRENDYTEGTAWQYIWLVPQDVEGLIGLLGGREKFLHKLDQLFTVNGDMGKEASPDISGLIGQYAHGNEPSHHIAYLYALAGQQDKTAMRVRQILNTLYTAKPDGLSGNEDVGQMSAWYVISTLGFYQVDPSGGTYVIGSPNVKSATIRLENGKTFKVVAANNSDENVYINSATLNGRPYNKSTIDYRTIMAGGVLEFKMGNRPNGWGNTAN